MTSFIRISQKLVFHQSKCICAIKRILSTTAMYVSSISFMYLRTSCYCDACLNSSDLRVGVTTLLNTIQCMWRINVAQKLFCSSFIWTCLRHQCARLLGWSGDWATFFFWSNSSLQLQFVPSGGSCQFCNRFEKTLSRRTTLREFNAFYTYALGVPEYILFNSNEIEVAAVVESF